MTSCTEPAREPPISDAPAALLLPRAPREVEREQKKKAAQTATVIVPEVPPPPAPTRLEARTYPVNDALSRALPPSILDALDTAFRGRLDVYAHVVESSTVHAFAEDGVLAALIVDTPTGRLTSFRVVSNGTTRWFDESGRRSDTGQFLGRPLALSRITSRYGTRLHPITGDVRNHRGVDYGAATGTPIYAIADGVVATHATDAASGNWLKLDHQGRQSLYLHLNAFGENVAEGAAVKQGQVIGFVGTTGRSTGPHLHFEMRIGPVSIDPLQTLPIPNEVLNNAERANYLPRVSRILAAAPPRPR
jgi:murein DD-endopeptidase MepM/ murein hydrolase activator NlpD